MDERELGAVSALLSDFSIRMNDLEERTRLLKDRLLMLSKTVLKNNGRFNKDLILIKDDITEIKNELDRLKDTADHLVTESSEFARRDELRIFERYIKMFEPLKFATIDDVKKLISKALKEKKQGIIRVRE